MEELWPYLHESLVTRAVINGAMYAVCCDADFYGLPAIRQCFAESRYG